ncbi:MAG: hypothetical protein GF355_12295 [Candidatus Eisenbacteria bacterium]|nr:hypothetical protein [Candidatus Eisenbacteria bacterium]
MRANQCERERLRPAAAALMAVFLFAGGPAAAQGPDLPPFPWDLQTCLAMAQEGNLELAQARAATRVAKGQYHQSYGQILPSISGSLDFTRRGFGEAIAYENPNTGEIVTRPGRYSNTYSLGGSIRQPVFDMESVYNIRSSMRRFDSSQHGQNAAHHDLILAVTERYYALLEALRLEHVAEEAVQLAGDQFRRTESLYQLGSVPRADVLQARVTLAGNELDLITARNTVRNERAQLAVAVGLSSGIEVEIDTTLVLPPTEREWDERQLNDWAQSGRPDLLEVRADVRAAEEQVRAKTWSRFPTVNATAFYGKQEAESGEILDDLAFNASWGFTLSLDVNPNPIDQLLLGSTQGAVEQSVWRARQERRRLDQKRLQVQLEIRQGILAWEEAEERLAAAQENLTYAEENLKLQRALYEGGGGTLLEWNNAQVELTRARSEVVQAEVDVLTALAGLERSVGRALR